MANRAKTAVLALVFGAAAVFLPAVAFAADGTWSLDPATSSARFFQGSAANPDSVNTGVARVSGNVSLDPNNLNNSVIDLTIYPADENWIALNPDGSLPPGYVPDSTDKTLLAFRSQRIVQTADGKLEVTGKLTLTRVERSVTIEPTEAYSGAVLGSPVVWTETREATFVFPNFGTAEGSGSVKAAVTSNKKTLNMRAATAIGGHDFPGLLSALAQTNWPAVVENEDCQLPANIGEDYSGATCTGTLIAATNYDNCQMPGNVGESYSGPHCTAPAGNQITIALHLNLTLGGPSTKVLTGGAR